MAEPVFEAPYRVEEIARVTPGIAELRLVPRGGEPLAYLPGQYVLLADDGGLVAERSYSIAHAPRPDGRISLLVGRVAGGQSASWVHDRLRPGEGVLVSGPYGTFVDDPGATAPALFLAGGTGLAPVQAILEAALRDGRREALTLLFSARTGRDVIGGERYARLDREQPRFRFVRTLTRPDPGDAPPFGRLPAQLAELCGPLARHDVYIAGPAGFVRDCAAAALALDAARERVRTEPFFAEPQPWTGSAPAIVG